MPILKIKAKQITSLATDVDERLTRRLAAHVAHLFGEAQTTELCLGQPDRLNGLIREDMECAAQHGFHDAPDVAQVITLLLAGRMFQDGTDPLTPWFREVLERTESSTTTRLAWITHCLHEQSQASPEASRLVKHLQATRDVFG